MLAKASRLLKIHKFLLGNKKANRFSQLRIVPKAVADSVEREAPFYLKDQGDSFLNTLVPRLDQNPANPSFGKSSLPVEPQLWMSSARRPSSFRPP